MIPKMSQNSPLIIERDQYFDDFLGFIKHFSLNENYFFITLVFLFGEGWYCGISHLIYSSFLISQFKNK